MYRDIKEMIFYQPLVNFPESLQEISIIASRERLKMPFHYIFWNFWQQGMVSTIPVYHRYIIPIF